MCEGWAVRLVAALFLLGWGGPYVSRQTSFAQVFELPVAFDRWMYPFNITPGTRAIGSTFGAFHEPDFDNRDGQIILGFNTSTVQPLSGNTLAAAKVNVTVAVDQSFYYDPTLDTVDTYRGQPDGDLGRPWELYGVATRNGFTSFTLDDNDPDPTRFRENSPFSPSATTYRGVRNAYVSDYAAGLPRDISNNVDHDFEVIPWAIGITDAVSAGSLVPRNALFEFAIDLDIAQVRQYIEEGLAAEAVFLGVSSLHQAEFGGGTTYPAMYLDTGGTNLGPTARLVLEFAPRALAGDFNQDGQLTCADVDLLVAMVVSGDTASTFDLNSDGFVDRDDVHYWVLELKQTLLGDANLDFAVDGSDFGVWNANKFNSAAAWCAGDFTANGVVDGSDFGIWNANKFQSVTMVSIPEPASHMWIWMVALFGWYGSRIWNRRRSISKGHHCIDLGETQPHMA